MAIKKCTCESEYQDRKYGKGMRVMNRTANKKSENNYYHRCTICGKEQ